MKKLILTVALISLLSAASVSFAQYSDSPVAPNIQIDIWSLLTRATNWFFGIVIFIAAIMLIAAGFNYVTSGGNEDKMKIALNTLIYALIGVAIAFLAKGMIYMICSFINPGGACSFF
jgi:hypothetical protein